ncbi:hypothetical protein QWY90_05870 [Flavobacterium paronense]|uniref:SGNH/GDSL hydrolase family protein n=2 Tax=Flavobacterium paronense TaxID=1392775 RepID=A0ABV5GCD8_9FLAO|nr:hypothetical protein [Flavobacterium paronense]MDN3676835.1 hypothetical protein [Flavobacterium paronense]
MLLIIGIISVVQIAISYRIDGKTVTGYDTLESTANTNADLVCLGSSRCWAHFDPRFFESNYHIKTINIGMNGHSDLTATLLRLQNYLSRNKAPKFAILNIDPFVSAGSLTNNTNFVTKNQYARYAFFPNEKDNPFLNYFKFDNYEKYVPLYALFKYQLFADCLTLKNANSFKAGFELNDEKWDTIKYPITAQAKRYFFKQKDIPQLEHCLKILQNLCQKNNIQLFCIQTPAYQITYDSATFEKPKTFCAKLGIPFIDANYESIRTKTDYFYNVMHLNKKGVIEMNKLLKNEKELAEFLK